MKYINQIIPKLEQAIKIRKSIVDMILELPDNTNIERQGKHGFSVKSSEVFKHNNLSPEYYDFKRQYKMIANKLESMPIENTVDWLLVLLEKGSIYYKNTNFKLHPEVIEYIKGIL